MIITRTFAWCFIFKAFTFLTINTCLAQKDAILILNQGEPTAESPEKPKNFRSSKDSFLPERLLELQQGKIQFLTPTGESTIVKGEPSRAGLNDLNISGSGQFSQKGLDFIIQEVEKRGGHRQFLSIADLREEPHDFIVSSEDVENAIPVSWYSEADAFSKGNDWQEVEVIENAMLKTLRQYDDYHLSVVTQKSGGKISQANFIHIPEIKGVYSEGYLVRYLAGLGYVRLAITDHCKPEDDDGDHIRLYFDSKTPSEWKHFHCAAGKGRTTTLMVLYDMMSNVKKHPELEPEDYVLRHYLLGGANLFKVPEEAYKRADALQRANFIRLYYQYLKETMGKDREFFRTWQAGKV